MTLLKSIKHQSYLLATTRHHRKSAAAQQVREHLPYFLMHHYSRFGVFLFKIDMHVKTVQNEFFAIEIIISIHISSLKKLLPKCEN